MNFLAPELLLGLLLVPIAIGFYLWAQRRRSNYAVRFTNLDLLANIAPRRPSWRRHLPPVLYLGRDRGAAHRPRPPDDGHGRPARGRHRHPDPRRVRLDEGDRRRRRPGSTRRAPPPSRSSTSCPPRSASGSSRSPPSPRRSSRRRPTVRSSRPRSTASARVTGPRWATRSCRSSTSPSRSRPTPPRPTRRPLHRPAPAPQREPVAIGVARHRRRTGRRPIGTAAGRRDPAVRRGELGRPGRAARCRRARRLDGVPIYTIALGTPDGSIQVRDDLGQLQTVPVPPDTETLRQIADTTGAKAFDAPTAQDLASVYDNLQSRIGYTAGDAGSHVRPRRRRAAAGDRRRGPVGGLVRPASVATASSKLFLNAGLRPGVVDFVRLRAGRQRSDLRRQPGATKSWRVAPARGEPCRATTPATIIRAFDDAHSSTPRPDGGISADRDGARSWSGSLPSVRRERSAARTGSSRAFRHRIPRI